MYAIFQSDKKQSKIIDALPKNVIIKSDLSLDIEPEQDEVEVRQICTGRKSDRKRNRKNRWK